MTDSLTASCGSQSTLDQSFAHCAKVTEERARNFYYGLSVIPEPKRSAMYAVYAWMRLADDLIDSPGTVEEKKQRAHQFRTETDQAYDITQPLPSSDAMWPAVRHTLNTYNISKAYLYDMIDGQLQDLVITRYGTFDELYSYCYKVASVVGLTSLEVWGYEGAEEVRKLAEYRGIAFQLTNILRDVLEDAQNDRVYLPAEDFDVFELSPTMFTLGDKHNALNGIRKVIARAEHYYKASEPLEQYVSPDGRPCLWAMTEIYHNLLLKIKDNPIAVLSGERVKLSKFRKVWIALRGKYCPPGGRKPAIQPQPSSSTGGAH